MANNLVDIFALPLPQKRFNFSNQKEKPPKRRRSNSPSKCQVDLSNKIISDLKTNEKLNSNLSPANPQNDATLEPDDIVLPRCFEDITNEIIIHNNFVKKIENEIIRSVESTTLSDFASRAIMNRVINDLNDALNAFGFINRWHCFGSYLYGLVSNESDIDVYYECLGHRSGALPENIPNKIVKAVRASRKFSKIVFIRKARVPVIKIVHNGTRKDCDITFSNEMGVRNSLLTKLYLSLNPNLRILVLYVKKLLKKYDIHGTSKITTHILFWLVAFFMQQKKLLPAVIDVRIAATEKYFVNGWDCSLPERFSYPSEPTSLYSLLLEFFAFYKDYDFMKYVICPYLGRSLLLSDVESLKMPEFSTYLQQLRNMNVTSFSRNCINLQDASDLSFNLAKQTEIPNVNKFKILCHHFCEILPNSLQKLASIDLLSGIFPNKMNFERYQAEDLIQFNLFMIHFQSLPQGYSSKLNENHVTEAVRKMMEIVFGFKLKNMVHRDVTQVVYKERLVKQVVSVLYLDYTSTDDTWKNDYTREIFPSKGNRRKATKVYLVCEICLQRRFVRVFVQAEVDFFKFLRENAQKLLLFILEQIVTV